MTIHLPEDLESSIRAEVDRGRFATVDDAVAEAVRIYLGHAPQAGEPIANGRPEGPAERKSFPERVVEIFAEIPPEEWDKVPSDGSAQHDHYIYGTPKRPAP